MPTVATIGRGGFQNNREDFNGFNDQDPSQGVVSATDGGGNSRGGTGDATTAASPFDVLNMRNNNFRSNELPRADITDLPGFSNVPQINFEELMNMARRGGGGGGNNPALNNAGTFLDNLFANGSNLGSLDPNLVGTINNLTGQSGQDFGSVLNTIQSRSRGIEEAIGGDDLIRQLMGELNPSGSSGGSSGSGGFSFRPGSSGGNRGQSAEDIFNGLPEFQVRDIDTTLPGLDEATKAELDAVLAADQAEFEKFRGDQNNELLTRMFGQGVQQSTVAGEATARANEGLERTLLNLKSQDAGRRLDVRNQLGNRSLEAQLAQLGAESGAFSDRLGSATSIRNTNTSANASRDVASIGAGASAFAANRGASAQENAARLGALSDIFRSRSSSLADIFGSEVGGLASGLNSRQGALSEFANVFGNLAASQANTQVQGQLGLGELASGTINNAQRNRANAGNAQFNRMMQILGLQEGVAGRLQHGQLTREQLQNSRDLGFAGMQNDVNIANLTRDRGPSSLDRALGVAGAVIPFFTGGFG